MLIRFVLTLLLLSTLGCGGNHWEPLSSRDLTLQGVYTAVAIYDLKQTRKIIDDPTKYERLFILGKDPSKEKVNTLIPLAIVAHGLYTWYLDPYWRPVWQYSWIGIEADAVEHNYRIGIRVEF